MKALVQRVHRAQVNTEGAESQSISKGLLVLLGIGKEDQLEDVKWLSRKLVSLRVFPNDEDKPHFSVLDLKLPVLIVSQFTLYGVCDKGARPDFTSAARPNIAKGLYEGFLQHVHDYGLVVRCGVFGAKMTIESVNDGPFTLFIESPQKKL